MPVNPYLVSFGAEAGGSLFDTLFGKENPFEKFNMAGLESLQSQLRTPAINIPGARAGAISAAIPQIGRQGEAINRRFGFDTGAGQQAGMSELLRLLTDFDLNRAPGLQLANAQVRSNLARTLATAQGEY